jgi:hypothetical protein
MGDMNIPGALTRAVKVALYGFELAHPSASVMDFKAQQVQYSFLAW